MIRVDLLPVAVARRAVSRAIFPFVLAMHFALYSVSDWTKSSKVRSVFMLYLCYGYGIMAL